MKEGKTPYFDQTKSTKGFYSDYKGKTLKELKLETVLCLPREEEPRKVKRDS